MCRLKEKPPQYRRVFSGGRVSMSAEHYTVLDVYETETVTLPPFSQLNLVIDDAATLNAAMRIIPATSSRQSNGLPTETLASRVKGRQPSLNPSPPTSETSCQWPTKYHKLRNTAWYHSVCSSRTTSALRP